MLPLRTNNFGGDAMEGAFESWIGQEVVVQVALGQIRVRLRGMLLKERTATLLMRPAVGSDIEIPKTTVLAIEELVRMPKYPRWLNASDARWTIRHSLFCHSAQNGPLLGDILNRESRGTQPGSAVGECKRKIRLSREQGGRKHPHDGS